MAASVQILSKDFSFLERPAHMPFASNQPLQVKLPAISEHSKASFQNRVDVIQSALHKLKEAQKNTIKDKLFVFWKNIVLTLYLAGAILLKKYDQTLPRFLKQGLASL